MSFNVSADAYLRFMGQYSEPLAVQFAELGKLHGVGPKALRLLQEALERQGMSLG